MSDKGLFNWLIAPGRKSKNICFDSTALEEQRILEMKQAAAPDLYEALQDIVEMTDNNRIDWHLRLFDIQKKAKAALAKADGVKTEKI